MAHDVSNETESEGPVLVMEINFLMEFDKSSLHVKCMRPMLLLFVHQQKNIAWRINLGLLTFYNVYSNDKSSFDF